MDILQPLYEFGALRRYLKETGKTTEYLKLHTEYSDLSHIYYKIKGNLSEKDLEDFEAHEEVTYCRLIISIEKFE